MESIYRTPEGRAEILAWYDRSLAQLRRSLALESRRVETRFGETHLLVAGPERAAPLVLLHGSGGSALEMAAAFGALAGSHRCYFLDVPGEPNRSSETSLDKRGDACARWALDVLGALGLERVALLGMSQGGYLALRCCAALPKRLSHVVLLVPEGLVRPRPLPFLRKVIWPVSRYRHHPTERNARRMVAAIAALPEAQVADATVERMGLVMRHVSRVARLGQPLRDRSLAGLEAPLLLVCGGRDPIFPGHRSIRRAREIVPRLAAAMLLPHAGHAHPDLVGEPVIGRIAALLAGDGGARGRQPLAPEDLPGARPPRSSPA